MTESEAKVILESEYKFHGECSVFGEALTIAINALEKQEKIKEVIANANKWSNIGFWNTQKEVISADITRRLEVKERARKR